MKKRRLPAIVLAAVCICCQLSAARAAGAEATSYYVNNHIGRYSHADRLSGHIVQQGVDVSAFQGGIDWHRVRAAGVEFAMVRLGGRWYGDSGSKSPDGCFYMDSRYYENMSGAAAAGIPTGVYFFSQATTVAEAVEEARFVLRNLGGYRVTLPIAMDVEYAVASSGGGRYYTGRLYKAHLSRREATDVCLAFCREIRAAGHTPMVYGNAEMFNDHLYMDEIAAAAEVWIATFGTYYASGSGYYGNYSMWQFTDRGSVDGVSGNVDLDFRYVEPLDRPRLNTPAGQNGGVQVSWGAVAGAEKYRVFVRGGFYGSGWTKLADVAGTDYLHAAVRSGETYTYTVRCVSRDGGTYLSDFDPAGRTLTYLSAPKLAAPVGENGGVRVSWSAVQGAGLYRVYVKGGAYGGSWTKLADVAGTGYLHAAAQSGESYTYTVRCLSGDGRAFAGGFDAAGRSIRYLPQPVLCDVSSESAGVRVRWNAVSGAERYRVFVKGGAYGGGWTKLADVTTTACVHAAAVSGTRYTYTVRCLSADGRTYTSGYDAVGRTLTYLSTPALHAPVGANEGVRVSWDAVPGAAGYRVFLRSGDDWRRVADVTGTTYVHTAAQSGERYTYTVRCLDSDGKTLASSYEKSGASVTYLSAPALRTPVGTAEGVRVSWDAVSGAEAYRVFMKNGSSWKRLADVTGTTYVHTAARPGESYTYTVRCVSADGKTFAGGYDTAGRQITFLSVPALHAPVGTNNGVQVSWDAVSGAGTYRVFLKDGSTWKRLADVKGTSFVHKEARPGTRYTYTVRCLSDDGRMFTGGYDPAGASVTFLDTPQLYEPVKKPSGVQVSWRAVSGAQKYRVFVKGGAYGGTWRRLADVTGTSYLHTAAQSGVRYTYTVRCVSDDGKTFTGGYDTAGRTLTA